MRTEVGMVIEEGFDLDEFNGFAKGWVEYYAPQNIILRSLIFDDDSYVDFKKCIENFAGDNDIGDIMVWNNALLGNVKIRRMKKEG